MIAFYIIFYIIQYGTTGILGGFVLEMLSLTTPSLTKLFYPVVF